MSAQNLPDRAPTTTSPDGPRRPTRWWHGRSILWIASAILMLVLLVAIIHGFFSFVTSPVTRARPMFKLLGSDVMQHDWQQNSAQRLQTIEDHQKALREELETYKTSQLSPVHPHPRPSELLSRQRQADPLSTAPGTTPGTTNAH